VYFAAALYFGAFGVPAVARSGKKPAGMWRSRTVVGNAQIAALIADAGAYASEQVRRPRSVPLIQLTANEHFSGSEQKGTRMSHIEPGMNHSGTGHSTDALDRALRSAATPTGTRRWLLERAALGAAGVAAAGALVPADDAAAQSRNHD
jgi:hypothetical protein